MEVKINTNKFDDRDILKDSLLSQKYMTQCYNMYANECCDVKLRDELVNILCEEHQIQADIFAEMKKRGYYETQNAEHESIAKAKQKFQDEMKNL